MERKIQHIDVPPNMSYDMLTRLDAFIAYCFAHPTHTFWRALTDWCGHEEIRFHDTNPKNNKEISYNPYYDKLEPPGAGDPMLQPEVPRDGI